MCVEGGGGGQMCVGACVIQKRRLSLNVWCCFGDGERGKGMCGCGF